MNALLDVVASSVNPAIKCLVAGGLKCLYDYQASQRWAPALVDGGITALAVAAGMLSVNGAVSGAQRATTPKVAPAVKP